ncbi:MAG TPA: class I SAM-dependent methyltransferase [Actinomycetota bacterium]|nr:class I SAM-dependent methyltransferase [Actinomycetota bacterium]
MSSERGAHARHLFDGIARDYDRPAEILGLGQYHRWRRELVAGLDLAPKSLVLDVATGTGLVARDILDRYEVRLVGLDQSAEMIRVAANRGIEGFTPVRGDAQRIPFPDGAFDVVVFTYLLRYVEDPAATLAELARVLRPGGVMGSIEFGVPPNALVRKAWDVYAMLLFPAAARVLSPGWRRVGNFLGGSIAAFDRDFPPSELEGLWREAGLHGVRTKRMSLGGGVITWGRKP